MHDRLRDTVRQYIVDPAEDRFDNEGGYQMLATYTCQCSQCASVSKKSVYSAIGSGRPSKLPSR